MGERLQSWKEIAGYLTLAGDPEGQCFGDGLADDTVNALVRIPGLRVTARTSSFAMGARGLDVRPWWSAPSPWSHEPRVIQ